MKLCCYMGDRLGKNPYARQVQDFDILSIPLHILKRCLSLPIKTTMETTMRKQSHILMRTYPVRSHVRRNQRKIQVISQVMKTQQIKLLVKRQVIININRVFQSRSCDDKLFLVEQSTG